LRKLIFATAFFATLPLLERMIFVKWKKAYYVLLITGIAVVGITVNAYCSSEVKRSLIGTWSNGKTEWAYRYLVTFYEDGTVERRGYRNFENGTYSIKGQNIEVEYNECLYDAGGFVPIEGYRMVYYYDMETGFLERKKKRDLIYVDVLSQNNYFDNDDYSIPLFKIAH